ncbi:MAG: TetR/AcrR family transcriptional regulator [Chloroflexi bacterium]|nr:TetR/AcrR family transcriptional regulator [Chloroflexota bacterium]
MTMVSGAARYTNERAEARRGEILEAAAAVFARRGYHQARTREIAEEAGISEGSIYNYFTGKRDLLLAIMDRIVTESIPQVYTRPESHDLRGLATAFVRDRLEMLDRNQQLLKAVVPEAINDEELRTGYLHQVTIHLVNSLVPLAQQALATGELRQFDARVLLPAIAGAVITAFVFNEMVDFPMGEPVSREELADELLGIFLDGLRKRDQTNASQP